MHKKYWVLFHLILRHYYIFETKSVSNAIIIETIYLYFVNICRADAMEASRTFIDL